jgi:hypothetical protein
MISSNKEPEALQNYRYTPDGDVAVESRINHDQQLIAKAVTELVPAENFRALVLIGGYARGEGGFRHVNGKPEPYNDYDYFVVIGGISQRGLRALKPLLVQLGHSLTATVGVEVDLEILKEELLPKAEYSLMHAEMLWGHRVVAGNQDILASMPGMPFARLALAEFTRLMLNRGSLLLMNRSELAAGRVHEAQHREQFLKYLFKAVLASGDARLAAAGQYHPGYTEKWRRLQQMQWPGHEQFLSYYEMALEAKFHPSYEQFSDADLVSYLRQVTALWMETLSHLETTRLGSRAGSWAEYASPSVCKGQSKPGIAGLARNIAVTLRDYGPSELLTNFRWSLRYPRERLISSLPGLLGAPGLVHETQLTNALGLQPGGSWREMAKSYLEQWHRYS